MRKQANDWLNADLSQNERESVMAATRRGDLRFLVATDVAARGIDISHLTHVINYDFPDSAESYVHRTGRTGRAGRTGTAISLIAPNNIGALYLMRLTYKIRPIERHLPSARERKTRAEADLVQIFVQAPGRRSTVVRMPTGDSVAVFDGRSGWVAEEWRPLPLIPLSGSNLAGARMDARLGETG